MSYSGWIVTVTAALECVHILEAPASISPLWHHTCQRELLVEEAFFSFGTAVASIKRLLSRRAQVQGFLGFCTEIIESNPFTSKHSYSFPDEKVAMIFFVSKRIQQQFFCNCWSFASNGAFEQSLVPVPMLANALLSVTVSSRIYYTRKIQEAEGKHSLSLAGCLSKPLVSSWTVKRGRQRQLTASLWPSFFSRRKCRHGCNLLFSSVMSMEHTFIMYIHIHSKLCCLWHACWRKMKG